MIKKWDKDIENMTDEEVDQLLTEYYNWKERIVDDLK
jgi:hypothetical protein